MDKYDECANNLLRASQGGSMRLGLHANGQAEAGRRFWTESRNGIYHGINDRVVCEYALAYVVWRGGCFVILDGGVKWAKYSTPLSYIEFSIPNAVMPRQEIYWAGCH